MELQKESVCFKVNEGCRAVEKKGRKEVAGREKGSRRRWQRQDSAGEKIKPETAEENGRNDGEIICRDDHDEDEFFMNYDEWMLIKE